MSKSNIKSENASIIDFNLNAIAKLAKQAETASQVERLYKKLFTQTKWIEEMDLYKKDVKRLMKRVEMGRKFLSLSLNESMGDLLN